MTPTMTVDEYIKLQEADLAYRENLSRTDPERAAREARERLFRAGIIDAEGRLTDKGYLPNDPRYV